MRQPGPDQRLRHILPGRRPSYRQRAAVAVPAVSLQLQPRAYQAPQERGCLPRHIPLAEAFPARLGRVEPHQPDLLAAGRHNSIAVDHADNALGRGRTPDREPDQRRRDRRLVKAIAGFSF
jgi:hypothetical protein